MLLTHAILTSTVAGSALASFHQLQPKSFHKRQEFNPDITQCGPGDTCAESCGAGFELCSDATTFLCYNPSAGDSCCEGGSSFSWACPTNSFCLVDDFCCPDGQDPNTCAASNGISLPSTFVATTATSSATSASYTPASATPTATTSVQTSAVVSPASSDIVGTFTQPAASSTSPIVAPFTGAANVNNVLGSTGLLYGVLELILNLL